MMPLIAPFRWKGAFSLSGGGLSGLYFVGLTEFSTTYCSYPQIMGCQNWPPPSP
jgi:hypothetical protein